MSRAARSSSLNTMASGIFLSSAPLPTIITTATGSDHSRARAKEKHGRGFSASEIDVIGDTPRDIACGKALGARTIAVATGIWSRDQLAKYQPDFLIGDLSNVKGIIDTLGW